MSPRETANNAYANFWDDKQKVLWCVVVFSGVVNLTALLISVVFFLKPLSIYYAVLLAVNGDSS